MFLYRGGVALARDTLPRRKYGRLRKAIPPVKEEKCRYCKLGYPCPVHKKDKG